MSAGRGAAGGGIGGGAHVQRFVVGGVAAVQRVGDGDQWALGAGPGGARLRLRSGALLVLLVLLAQVGLQTQGCAQRRPASRPKSAGPARGSAPPRLPTATAPGGTRTARPAGDVSRSTRCPRRPPPPAPRTAPPEPPRQRRQRASLRPPAGKRGVTAGGGRQGPSAPCPPPLACSSCTAGGGSRSGSARAWMTPLAAAMSHSTTAESLIHMVSCGGEQSGSGLPAAQTRSAGGKEGGDLVEVGPTERAVLLPGEKGDTRRSRPARDGTAVPAVRSKLKSSRAEACSCSSSPDSVCGERVGLDGVGAARSPADPRESRSPRGRVPHSLRSQNSRGQKVFWERSRRTNR